MHRGRLDPGLLGPPSVTVTHNVVTGAGALFPQDGIFLRRTSATVVDNDVRDGSRDGIGLFQANGAISSRGT